MKSIVLGVLLSAAWGVSQAGCLVINNSSNISFSGHDEQPGTVMSQSLGADVGNFNSLDNMFSNMAPVPEPQVVPEPQAYAMMLAGLGLLGLSLRRRKDENFE